MSYRSCGHYVMPPHSRGDCAKQMNTRMSAPRKFTCVYTRVPGPLLDYIQYLCSACHNSIPDQVGMCPWQATGHSQTWGQQRGTIVLARTYMHRDTYITYIEVASWEEVSLLFTSRQLRNWANRDRARLTTMEARGVLGRMESS